MSKLRVAIIGAGVSGATLASLIHQNVELVVFEKSRGVGGRLSTRRVDNIGAFDHGAQFFTCRTPEMQPLVEELLEKGCIVPWEAPLVRIDAATGTSEPATPGPRYVGVGKAARLVEELLEGGALTLRLDTEVAKLSRQGQAWIVADHAGTSFGHFDILVLTTPPKQAATLLDGVADNSLVQHLHNVPMAPCWCLLAYWPEATNTPFAGAFVQNSPLSWVARNETKPGRSINEGEIWTVHASATWSASRSKEQGAEVERELSDALRALLGRNQEPSWIQSHYWRYAQAAAPQTVACYWDSRLRLGLCGDWFPGERLEGAFISAWHLALEIKNFT